MMQNLIDKNAWEPYLKYICTYIQNIYYCCPQSLAPAPLPPPPPPQFYPATVHYYPRAYPARVHNVHFVCGGRRILVPIEYILRKKLNFLKQL